MAETVFKVGDRVFNILYGWGVIKEIQDSMITIDFNGENVYGFSDSNLLSFTEYTLQGFTQERPIVLPEVGELCLVRDNYDQHWIAVVFKGYNPTTSHPYIAISGNSFRQMKRIKILD